MDLAFAEVFKRPFEQYRPGSSVITAWYACKITACSLVFLSVKFRPNVVRFFFAMAEKDFLPLTQNIVRGLNDKLYEKRKTAALEIER